MMYQKVVEALFRSPAVPDARDTRTRPACDICGKEMRPNAGVRADERLHQWNCHCPRCDRD